MSNLPVDRDKEYMKKMWGTTKLITDYGSDDFLNKIEELEAPPFEAGPGHFTQGYGFFSGRVQKQNNLHEKIRNDDDYDDWEYGTEPIYGKRW